MRSVKARELYLLLGQAVGDTKAQEVVDKAARELGMSVASGFSTEEALEVLDQIANTPGLVGITARFAKSRLLLSG